MQKRKTHQIVWFTTNLRVHDNVVLQEALNSNEPIIGVYCFDPRHYDLTAFGFKKTEKFRAKFIVESVANLKANLSRLNVPLLVYFERPEQILPKLAEEFNSTAIYFQEEF